MNEDNSPIEERLSLQVGRTPPPAEHVGVVGTYTAVLRDKDGNVKWEETGTNLTPTEGIQKMLTVHLDADTAVPLFYLSIYTAKVSVLDGSSATNIAGVVTEFQTYSTSAGSTQRSLLGWAAPSGRGITGTAATITIDPATSGTILGAFVINEITVPNNGTTLMSVIDFSVAPAVNGSDTLDITWTLTLGSSDIDGN